MTLELLVQDRKDEGQISGREEGMDLEQQPSFSLMSHTEGFHTFHLSPSSQQPSEVRGLLGVVG